MTPNQCCCPPRPRPRPKRVLLVLILVLFFPGATSSELRASTDEPGACTHACAPPRAPYLQIELAGAAPGTRKPSQWPPCAPRASSKTGHRLEEQGSHRWPQPRTRSTRSPRSRRTSRAHWLCPTGYELYRAGAGGQTRQQQGE